MNPISPIQTSRPKAPFFAFFHPSIIVLGAALCLVACTGERGSLPGTGNDAGSVGGGGSGGGGSLPPGTGRICASDSDCENGLMCDGIWRCNGEFGCERIDLPVSCDDGVICTIDECVEPDGSCEHIRDNSRCEDDDPCTLNLCEASGCEFPNAPDGTPCPDGLCHQGSCCPGCWDGLSCQPGDELALCGTSGVLCENCDDENPCTTDSCGESGCVHVPAVDGTDCGSGVCSMGECCEGCIAIDGSCLPGTDLFACGVSGGLCTPCACASDTCDAGSCPPGIYQVQAVSAGRDHTCSLGTNGALFCWGSNDSRRAILDPIVAGTTLTLPTQADINTDWTDLSVEDLHGCGVRTSGTEHRLFCWGAGTAGQLGTGASPPSSGPTEVSGARVDWGQVDVGGAHTCATTIGGLLFCWGSDSLGQLGLEGRASYTTPQQIERGFPTAVGWQQVSASRQHTCAVRRPGVGPERELWCWGNHGEGQLGIGDRFGSLYETPQQVADNDWESVSTGPAHTCAVRLDGSLWCWGSPRYGRLGTSPSTNSSRPGQVGVETNWAQVSAGTLHTCGVQDDGSLWCWGRGSSFALGLGPTAPEAVTIPTRVGVETDWLSVSAGYAHTCAVRRDLTIHCWGSSPNAQLGLGDTMVRHSPNRVCY